MKFSFKFFSLFIFFLFGGTFLICFLNSCCKSCDNRCYGVHDFYLRVFDNGGQEPKAIEQGKVFAKALMVELSLIGTINDSLCVLHKITDPFTPVSYAAMCAPCRSGSTVIQSYVITSNEKFDVTHDAHTSLNDLFYIPETLNGQYEGDFLIYLNAAPEKESIHQFKIQLVTTNDDTLIQTLPPLKLLKK